MSEQYKHKGITDPDFEDELLISEEMDKPKVPLTQAEKEAKARELQKKIQAKNKEKEKAAGKTFVDKRERERL